MLTLTFVRHGETVANKSRTIQGQSDGCLTKLGALQAERLGHRLAKEHFDVIICSDLLRTQQTAACIMKCRPMQNVYLEPMVRERAAGVLEGKGYGTHEKMAKAAGISSRLYSPERGESWQDVMKRAEIFARRLAETFLAPHTDMQSTRPPHGNPLPSRSSPRKVSILLVTHGGFIKEFINQWCRLGRGSSLYPNKAQNTSLFQFHIKCRPGYLLPCVHLQVENDISHLTGWQCTDENQEKACCVSLENLHTKSIPWSDVYSSRKELSGKI
ncbi:fructose-2,6-bisphosphatase TIGAR B-like [Ptychodera flava]|uniref:fructose-2,6-bisphosphatase TIGAR B-like n=1 Tax=Ptychodera flava TaxID=63121 RepID=UPI00396A7D89